MDEHEYNINETDDYKYQADCTCGWEGNPRYTESVAYYDAGRHMGAATGEESD